MSTDNKQQWFAQASAIFRAMLRKGKPVAFEDAIKPIQTDDWFDRRGFGWIPAVMNRDREIETAGYHHCDLSR